MLSAQGDNRQKRHTGGETKREIGEIERTDKERKQTERRTRQEIERDADRRTERGLLLRAVPSLPAVAQLFDREKMGEGLHYHLICYHLLVCFTLGCCIPLPFSLLHSSYQLYVLALRLGALTIC